MPKKHTSTTKVTFGNGTKTRKGVHAKNKTSWNPNSKNYKKQTQFNLRKNRRKSIRVKAMSLR